jgi:hypothetical protein
MDDAESHFDFLNVTGGTPDDTWTSTDYTTLEGYLDTWWNSVKPSVSSGIKLAGYHWYRHGPGVGTPNPAERVVSRSVAGGSGSNALPPQVASTVTFRTAVRRSWGRTYLPGPSATYLATDGSFDPSGWVNPVATATDTLVHAAAGADFPLVVTSVHLSAVLNVEATEVDNTPDIIRRRRFDSPTIKVIHNT